MADVTDAQASSSAAETSFQYHPPLHHVPWQRNPIVGRKRCRPKDHHSQSCPCCEVSPKRRRRHRTRPTPSRPSPSTSANVRMRRRKTCANSTPRMVPMASSSKGLCSKKFLLLCSCFYLLSGMGSSTTEASSSNNNGNQNGSRRKKRYLRSAVVTAPPSESEETLAGLNDGKAGTAHDHDSDSSAGQKTPLKTPPISPGSDSFDKGETVDLLVGRAQALMSKLSSSHSAEVTTNDPLSDKAEPSLSQEIEEEEEEEFDYEAYRAKYHIPVPALGMVALADLNGGEADIAHDHDSNSRGGSKLVSEPSLSNEIEEDEEFDYEAYHAKHNIPVPALGATMMGLMNTNINNANTQHEVLEEENTMPRGILAFAGTNQAMKQFASGVDDDYDDDAIGDKMYFDEMEDKYLTSPESYNPILYETTLAHISQSHSSLLWGSDPFEEVQEDGADNASSESYEEKAVDALMDRAQLLMSKLSSSDSAEVTTNDAAADNAESTIATTNDSEQQTPLKTPPMSPGSDSHEEVKEDGSDDASSGSDEEKTVDVLMDRAQLLMSKFSSSHSAEVTTNDAAADNALSESDEEKTVDVLVDKAQALMSKFSSSHSAEVATNDPLLDNAESTIAAPTTTDGSEQQTPLKTPPISPRSASLEEVNEDRAYNALSESDKQKKIDALMDRAQVIMSKFSSSHSAEVTTNDALSDNAESTTSNDSDQQTPLKTPPISPGSDSFDEGETIDVLVGRAQLLMSKFSSSATTTTTNDSEQQTPLKTPPISPGSDSLEEVQEDGADDASSESDEEKTVDVLVDRAQLLMSKLSSSATTTTTNDAEQQTPLKTPPMPPGSDSWEEVKEDGADDASSESDKEKTVDVLVDRAQLLMSKLSSSATTTTTNDSEQQTPLKTPPISPGSDSWEEVKEDGADDASSESDEEKTVDVLMDRAQLLMSKLSSSDSVEVTTDDVAADSAEVTTNDDFSDNAESTIATTTTTDDSEEQTPLKTPPMLPHKHRYPQTVSDLDGGRHLVGLEVREVRPHQQIIIDYQDASEENGEEQLMRPLRIRYILSDDTELNDGRRKSGILENSPELLKTLLETSFNRTATFWSEALMLPPVVGNIIPTMKTCGGATIPSLHQEKGVDNADILIYVSGDNRFCGGALMHSAICDYDQNMRPLAANINICTKNIPTTLLSHYGSQIRPSVLTEYDAYITTETARILGASTSLFLHYQNPDTDAPYGSSQKHAYCIDGTQETTSVPNIISENIESTTGTVYYEIRTPKVIEVVRNHFDCMTQTGARLEVRGRGSISCFGGFLDDHLFFGEQLSGFQIASKNKKGPTISPLTLALLEDSSWYIANYTISTEIPFGRGAGCQFSRGGCALDESGVVQEVSTHSKGFHCSAIGDLGCDVSHSFKAKCDLLHPKSEASTSNLIAGSASAQDTGVCPMYIRGAISCDDEGTEKKSVLKFPGEVYGKSSKCFLTDEGQPMCLSGKCNEETQTIDFYYKDRLFSCHHDGDIIDTKKGVRIECPRIAAVCPSLVCPSNCSGRGVCDEDRERKHTCICDDPFDESPGCWGQ